MVKNVLMVDDNFDDLEKMKDCLPEDKFAVKTSTNDAQALDLLKEGTYDLILIDIQMPTLVAVKKFGYDKKSKRKAERTARWLRKKKYRVRVTKKRKCIIRGNPNFLFFL